MRNLIPKGSLITGDPATEPEPVLSALEQAIHDVCNEDTQNAISDRYRELMGEGGNDA